MDDGDPGAMPAGDNGEAQQQAHQLPAGNAALHDDGASSGSWETAPEDGGGGMGDVVVVANGVSAEQDGEAGPSGAESPCMWGCEHYRRRVRLVAPCCGEVFWCRHCHNAVKSENEQDPVKRHLLDRTAVTEVVCAICATRQPVGLRCQSCNSRFGRYACLACNFWDDDESKRQFHCDKCGICRVGGRENYFHCDTCNCCYARELESNHVCIQNAMKHNCPVCCEHLFDSIKPINVLVCGHTIHQECLRHLANHGTYVCPVCSKTYTSASFKEQMWREMDEAVEATPMPPEYAAIRVNVMCNDCARRGNVPFHVLGHKCVECGGYNTRRV